MNWARAVRKLLDDASGDDPFSEHDAYQLLAAMLDDGIEALELGAALALLQARGVTLPQLLGSCRAMDERRFRLAAPSASSVRPVVFSSYAGTHEEPNLLPLLTLVLQRLGVPVLVHGSLNGGGRIATAHVLRELGVMPCVNLTQAQRALDEHKLAFVPTAVLAPGLADLLALKSRLGFDDFAQLLAKLLNPFDGEALLVVAAGLDGERNLMREFLRAYECNALLLEGTEGEAFANPRRRPQLEHISAGAVDVLFEAEAGPIRHLGALPSAGDAASTAHWIRRALDGGVPLPLPLVNELACCLYGSGYTDDLNQAKAIVAVETGSLVAA